jgi:hypothetical protein
MVQLWDDLGFSNEGTQRLESCLAVLPSAEHKLAAMLLSGVATLEGNSTHAARAFDAAERGVTEARQSNDPDTLFRSLRTFSVQARRGNRIEESVAADEELDRIENFVPSPPQRAAMLQNRAILANLGRDVEKARRFGSESRAQFRALGNVSSEASCTLNLAETEHQFGATERAIELVREILTRGSALGRGTRQHLHVNLAGYLISQDDVAGTRTTAAQALSAAQDLNSGLTTILIEHLALAHALSGDLRRAARLEGYCAAAFTATEALRESTEEITYDKLARLLGSTYSEEQLRALYAEGAALTQPEAVAEALHASEPASNEAAARTGATPSSPA